MMKLQLKRKIHPETESISPPRFENFFPVRYLPGLDIHVDSNPKRLYRFDGAVLSVPIHNLSVLREYGFRVKNKWQYVLSNWKQTGHCRSLFVYNSDYRISVPFYYSLGGSIDVFNAGHEDMHAVQHLEIESVYSNLEARLGKFGFKIELKNLEPETSVNITGFLRVMEKGFDVREMFGFKFVEQDFRLLEASSSLQ